MSTQTRSLADPIESPRYGLVEAAFYLGIPQATLGSWTRGRKYRTKNGPREFKPLIELADPELGWLSFANLAEAHVLAATRERGIPIRRIRDAIEYIAGQFPGQHPLLTQQFYHAGRHLFVQLLQAHQTIKVSGHGQLALQAVLDRHLKRLERDRAFSPIRICPMRADHIVLDVHVSSGRPVVKGTGILVSMLASRHRAGETVEELARDYRLRRLDVQEALRYAAAA